MKSPKKLILLMLICLGTVTVVTPANSINFKTTSHTEQEAANAVTDLLRSAYNALEAKKFDEALAGCAKAIELDPKDYRSYALSGYAYQAQRKLKSASEAFAKAIELRPDIKELYLSKSQVDYFRNAHEEALSAAKQAVKLDPGYAKAHLMVGMLLRWDKQRQAEAITAYETALSINPQLWPAYEELGAIFDNENGPPLEVKATLCLQSNDLTDVPIWIFAKGTFRLYGPNRLRQMAKTYRAAFLHHVLS